MESKKSFKKTAMKTDISIKISWWNLGRKELEFKGNLNDYLKKRHIKVSRISHPLDKEIKGYRFKMPVSSSVITFDDFYGRYENSALSAIRLFLTYLGDKATIESPYRDIRINH